METDDVPTAEEDTNTLVNSMASVYLPYEDQPPSQGLERLAEDARKGNWNLVIGCDSDAHSTAWGSADDNGRGKSRLEFIFSSNLDILNRFSEPTFITAKGQSVIDITLASMGISSSIHNWTVSDNVSMSDHRWITFDLGTIKIGKNLKRNPRKTDVDAFRSMLTGSLSDIGWRKPTESFEVDEYVNTVSDSLIKAYKKACPLRSKAVSGRATIWWCPVLGKLK
ncbi:uncharacterized protein [Onthophagus taurus]|uniref:uncharacterized protein n=1 Tax=Onthophagus taurus TaxID=166361 RepID=UPI0039BDE57E